MTGSLTLAARAWLAPVLVLVALGAGALLWGYARSSLRAATRAVALGLKLLGLALVAVCLVEPTWATRHAKPGANLFVVLADNSRGMTVHDRGHARSRGEELRAALGVGAAAGSPWLQQLGETFQLRRYLFDARLRRTQDFAELAFDGQASHIGTALRTVAERYRGAPLAGILLLTDGNATDLGEQPLDGSGLPPVYPVVVGGPKPDADVAVTGVSVSQTAFEDAPVTIQADIDAAGFAGRPVKAELVDAADRVVQSQELRVSQDDETLTARFRLRPEKPGLAFYRVRADAGASAREATAANNSRLVMVEGSRGPYRVLYVAGRPNWEYKFLRRALESDDQVQLVGLIRIAHREPKFVFRPRGDATANPLFQALGKKDEDETERYDQPVLVRLGTRDSSELRDGFPKLAETLFDYHALVLDDLEAAFFSTAELALIERFVSERGGGFLMLGGQGSFHEGAFDRTPIGQILPVYLDGPARPPPLPPARIQLSRDGWLAPWARLRDNEKDEQDRLDRMPAFQVLNQVGGGKPAASVLATVSAERGESYPALVAQRSGNGRAAALTIGDLWRWGLKHPEMQQDLGKLWRQTVRWLVADVPERVAIRIERQASDAGQSVMVRVRVRDRSFRAADDVAVALEITAPDGRKTSLPAPPAGNEAGLYAAPYTPGVAGGYRVLASVIAPDGSTTRPPAASEAGFVLDLDADEHRSLRANRALAETLAGKTGGQVVAPGDLERFVRDLPRRSAPVVETRTRPLWDSWLVFALATICFVAEWSLRRSRGLA